MRTLGFTGPVVVRKGREIEHIPAHAILYLPPENADELKRASRHVCDLTLTPICDVYGALVPTATVLRFA